MCDMAYVILLSQMTARLSYSSFSFGGGSELLRDGDANNIWALLEHGLASVSLLRPFVT